MDMDDLRGRASKCRSIVALDALFLTVTAGMGYVPVAMRRMYAENVERLGGMHQETGEQHEDMPDGY